MNSGFGLVGECWSWVHICYIDAESSRVNNAPKQVLTEQHPHCLSPWTTETNNWQWIINDATKTDSIWQSIPLSMSKTISYSVMSRGIHMNNWHMTNVSATLDKALSKETKLLIITSHASMQCKTPATAHRNQCTQHALDMVTDIDIAFDNEVLHTSSTLW